MSLIPERFPITRYFLSGTRYKLTMGCDGGLWLILSILCVMLGWTWRNVPGLVAAVLAYIAGITILRKIGKYDPLAVNVFMQNLQYKLIYGARSKVSAKLRSLPKKWMA